MLCRKCRVEIDNTPFCPYCGAKQQISHSVKKRGNGQGSVYKRGSTWQAEVRIKSGENILRRTKGGFSSKTDALKYIDTLRHEATHERVRVVNKTFIQIYDDFIKTHDVSKATFNCYNAAVKYFKEIHDICIRNITVDDLQDCINECEKGKRTQENMRAIAGLMYKYAIPRKLTDSDINLASYLKIYTKSDAKAKVGIPVEELEKIKGAVGRVPYAEHVYCMCLTGFRVREFLNLKISDYDRENHCLTGGSKTEAGINRRVTLSPTVEEIVQNIIGNRTDGYIFDHLEYTSFKIRFYECLENIGIDNPVIDDRHLYTPHSCRRTFATLIKNIDGSDKDKLELMGHTSTEMLRYYQDVNYSDLQNITNQL